MFVFETTKEGDCGFVFEFTKGKKEYTYNKKEIDLCCTEKLPNGDYSNKPLSRKMGDEDVVVYSETTPQKASDLNSIITQDDPEFFSVLTPTSSAKRDIDGEEGTLAANLLLVAKNKDGEVMGVVHASRYVSLPNDGDGSLFFILGLKIIYVLKRFRRLGVAMNLSMAVVEMVTTDIEALYVELVKKELPRKLNLVVTASYKSRGGELAANNIYDALVAGIEDSLSGIELSADLDTGY